MIKISFFSFAKTSNETKLPEKDNYNRLSVENIADANYAHGKKFEIEKFCNKKITGIS